MTKTCSNRECVLGVTGSIAAYKACEIASRLVKAGVRVTPALTASAQKLVGAASFEAICGAPALTDLFAPFASREIAHISVAQRAHLFLIAPATANILAKAAHGIADDWLSTTLLATRSPVLFAPAMNSQMYTHPATQANIETLRARGCRFIGPDTGRLACGTEGPGRMIAPETVVEAALPLLDPRTDLAGRHVLITSGGNREPIDPVRYIGNRSSGKMGRALAWEALLRGARVTVVTGPAETPLPHGAEVIRVETALAMAEAVAQRAPEADVAIGAAAVADYRVAEPLNAKRKRDGAPLRLDLVENPDILAAVGAAKRSGQIVAGFAAETDELLAHAAAKLEKKSLDLIVANEVGTADSGFGTETLRAHFLRPGGNTTDLGLITKETLAERLFDVLIPLLDGKAVRKESKHDD